VQEALAFVAATADTTRAPTDGAQVLARMVRDPEFVAAAEPALRLLAFTRRLFAEHPAAASSLLTVTIGVEDFATRPRGSCP
jgi:hypothetical protein